MVGGFCVFVGVYIFGVSCLTSKCLTVTDLSLGVIRKKRPRIAVADIRFNHDIGLTGSRWFSLLAMR